MKKSSAIGRTKRLALGFALLAALYGCAAERLHREGNDLLERGQIEEGLAKLEEAVKADPRDFKLRTDLINTRSQIIGRLLTTAASERAASRLDEAETIYQRVLKIDPGNERAQAGIDAIARDRRHAGMIEQAQEAFKKGDSEKAIALLKPVLAENPSNAEMLFLKRAIEEKQAKELMAPPTLKSLYTKPISLEFRDANLKMVFEVLSRTTGINFILDKDIKPDLKTTIFVKLTPVEDAVDLLLLTNQLEKKILNQNSVLVYPNTPAKVKDYQDLVVKAFYLANADVKQTVTMLKTVLKSKDIFVDEKLNLLVMRDTPDAVRLAEKLVALQDLGDPEVMLEVEVLEVQRNRLKELGIRFPDQVTLTPLPSGTALTLRDLLNLTSGRTGVTPPSVLLNLLNQKDIINLLANPRIRVRNREKAKILIGDRVPVITTTSTATGFVAESIQYLDVGLKLEVEPNIYLRDDVAIKVGLEVSTITNTVKTSTGTLTYQIGTRNANTVLRLKDGETQVLAGLISDQDRKTINSFPGIGDLPIAGRLFSNVRDEKDKTEIVLSITPHLIRNLTRLESVAEEFWSGNETVLKTKPLTLQTLRPTATSETQAPTQVAVAKLPVPPSAVDIQQAASEGGGVISLTWLGPKQAKLGEQISVELRIKSDSALRSLPLQVSFDPAVLQVVDIAEGGFFRQGDGKTNFASNVDQVGGKIFVGIARAGVDGAKGEGSVINITFNVVSVKPQGEINLLAATPVGTGGKVPATNLPDPYVISISNIYGN